ncbi:phiRv1 phage protein [Mobilicoccus pelagius]|uniref:Putative phiRv1 phage protein n=1 Tax=Mobilicoccus pelagius NBRC 104925 TaxID=1089455 RepID=H5UN90_9MICO|nr:phiRv1 phage protein [Mobilicoccus pelagius]GAB47198.1 putative phiRv1 phage protein [Mobilicoccus pelagius NBRC 104925]
MPTQQLKSRETRALAGRIAALSRSRTADDPEFIDTRRRHKESALADHIKAVVDTAPPLTDEQRERLVVLLRPSATNGGSGR